jgi:23S rRNA (guanosine2251-2'-O)-methyltransferase
LKFAAKKKAGVGSFVPEEKAGQTIKENPRCRGCFISGSLCKPRRSPEATDLTKNPIPLLDGVTDVGNCGVTIRTTECTGVTAIVVSEKGSAPINAVVKTSAALFSIFPSVK